MASSHRKFRSIGLVVAAIGLATTANAQNPIDWAVADGEYNVSTNWNPATVPSTEFDEFANISNGGVARLSSVSVNDPGQVILGSMAGESGTLRIENGGDLTLTFVEANLSTAGVDVGLGGSGTLELLPGGSLTAAYLTLGGEGGSTVALGGTGASTTTLNIGLAGILGQFGTTVGNGNTLSITGPNVDYSTLSFQVNAGGTFIADITDSTHSPVKSINAAVAGGTLRVEFDGVTPTAGDSWNLFDTPSISGQFAEIDTSAAPELPFGQVYTFKSVADPSSENGVYGQFGVEQQLVLNVNRDTGFVSIVTGPEPVDIDGYSISSELGGLNATNWNSLQDQNVIDWRESPQNGSDNRLSELKPTSSTSVNPGSGLQLGNIFQYPLAAEFGTEIEDIAFEYYTPDGRTVEATVMYEGDEQFNNLVLIVDPADGDAVLMNQSNIPVSIDGYKISSESGSLVPGDGAWMSLEDQSTNGGAWYESNPTATNLIELRPEGTTLLNGGATFNLGRLFLVGGADDLTLQYLFPEDNDFTRNGAVVYRDLNLEQLDGDYNRDGVVNAADYVRWRNTLNDNVTPGTGADGNGDGIVNDADYQVWRMHFGASLGPASASSVPSPVPEPGAIAMLMAGGTLALLGFPRFLQQLRTARWQ
jgi:hypothetical protein